MYKKEHELPLALAQQERNTRKKLSEYLFPTRKVSPIGINMTDTIIILFLLFIGIFTRIFRIQFPKQIICNEDRIGQQINYYKKGEYFQNYQNPPITSLFYYFISTIMNYDGSFDYKENDKFCTTQNHSIMNCIHIQFRTISAILSGFCPLLLYLTLRFLFYLSSSTSTLLTIRLSSLAAALFYTFETSFIAQERYMFIDGFLHHCICCTLFFVYFDHFYMFWHTFILKNIYLSLSFSISPSHSIGILVAIIIREFLVFKPNYIFKMNYALARSLFMIIFVILFQYFIFFIHLKILPYASSEENDDIPSFINESLLDIMKPDWKTRYENQSIFKLLIQITFLVFHRNSETKIDKKFESGPWKWPFGNFLKSILYTHDNDSSSYHYYACIPNIFIYSIIIGFIFLGFFLIIKYKKQNLIKKPKFFLDFIFLFIGYTASILPFFFIQKTFLYNYSVALIFGILLFSNVVEKLIHPKIRVYIYIVAIILSLVGLFHFSPYVYGLNRSHCNYYF